MISLEGIIEIGRTLKPHGILGELTFAPLYDIDLMQLHCIIMDIDGIFVPFFPSGVRTKGKDKLIVKIDGINNEKQAATLSNHIVFVLKSDVEITDETDSNDSEFLLPLDLINYSVIDIDTNDVIGQIEYIDDSTPNWLFMVRSKVQNDKMIAIPIAEEFIVNTDKENKTLELKLPNGLLELQR